MRAQVCLHAGGLGADDAVDWGARGGVFSLDSADAFSCVCVACFVAGVFAGFIDEHLTFIRRFVYVFLLVCRLR